MSQQEEQAPDLEQKEVPVDFAPEAIAVNDAQKDGAADDDEQNKTVDPLQMESIPKPDEGEKDVDLDEAAVPVESPPSLGRKVVWIAFPIILLIIIVIIVVVLLQLRAQSVSEEQYAAEIEIDILDEANLVYLDAKPDSYLANEVYNQFQFLLDENFVMMGNPRLAAFEAWYDAYNIEGMRFTFSNGRKDFTTEIFGIEVDRRGTATEYKKVELDAAVRNVNRLVVNTQVREDQTEHSGWYLVNFGLNRNDDWTIGYPNSKYSDEKALRSLINDFIKTDQRIVGVHGYTRQAHGTLRGINFILANEVVSEEDRGSDDDFSRL